MFFRINYLLLFITQSRRQPSHGYILGVVFGRTKLLKEQLQDLFECSDRHPEIAVMITSQFDAAGAESKVICLVAA